MSSDVIAAAVAATVLWVVSVGSFLMETPKRPAGEAWVVTASDKIDSRPMLVRETCRSRLRPGRATPNSASAPSV